MRGRLIFPFTIELRQLDTTATAGDPDAGGPLTSGYDEDFREPVFVPTTPGADTIESARKEAAAITVRAQIEPQQFESLEMMLSGKSPNSRFQIVCHYRDLEQANMLDATTKRPLIRIGDRLSRILDKYGSVVEVIPNPPGLFVTEVQSRGFGPGGSRNLLLVVFEERELSIRAP